MSGWNSSRGIKAREAWKLRLPVPCSRCGRDVEPDQEWDLDHLKSRSERPDLTWDQTNQWPAHASCNRSHGGRLGAKRRWAKQRQKLGVQSRAW